MKLKSQNKLVSLKGQDTVPFKYKKFLILVSYAFFAGESKRASGSGITEIFNNDSVEVMLDSGAYTAYTTGKPIDIDRYMDFLHTWKNKLFSYAMLDAIGDPAQTKKNLDIMLKNGLKPMPVHVRGDDKKRMEELYQASDYVALNTRGTTNRLDIQTVHKKMEWACGRKVHLFGTTDAGLLNYYTPYSCDSSSTGLQATAFGALNIYIGNGTIKGIDRAEYRYFRRRSIVQDFVSNIDIDLDTSQAWAGRNGAHELLAFAFLSEGMRQKYYAEKTGTRIFQAIFPEQFFQLKKWILDNKKINDILFT